MQAPRSTSQTAPKKSQSHVHPMWSTYSKPCHCRCCQIFKRCSWVFWAYAKLFTFFSAGTQRWSVLKKRVNITVKSWSDTRWESRLQSVHAIRYQASEVWEALLEARQTINDPVAKVEAQHLQRKLGPTASWFAVSYGVRYWQWQTRWTSSSNTPQCSWISQWI